MAITRPGAIENRTARGRSTSEGRQARDFLVWRGMRVSAGEENPEAGVAVGDRGAAAARPIEPSEAAWDSAGTGGMKRSRRAYRRGIRRRSKRMQRGLWVRILQNVAVSNKVELGSSLSAIVGQAIRLRFLPSNVGVVDNMSICCYFLQHEG